jgi:hypothetical protein
MTSIIGHSAEPDSPSQETRMNSEANDSTRDKGAVTRAVGRGRTSRADPQVPSLLDGGTGTEVELDPRSRFLPERMIEKSRPPFLPATGNHATRPHARALTYTLRLAAFGFLQRSHRLCS